MGLIQIPLLVFGRESSLMNQTSKQRGKLYRDEGLQQVPPSSEVRQFATNFSVVATQLQNTLLREVWLAPTFLFLMCQAKFYFPQL